MMGQSTIIDGIETVAKENGATILLQTAAEALVVDEDGRVVGVMASDADGKGVYLGGAKGVILTAGGFGMNIDMLKRYCPNAYLGCAQGGPMPWDTGEVTRMGLGVGADMAGFDSFSLWEGGIDEYYGDGDGQFWHYFFSGRVQLTNNPWLTIDERGRRVPYYAIGEDPESGEVGGLGTGAGEPLQHNNFSNSYSIGDCPTAAARMSTVGHRSYQIFDADYATNIFKLSTHEMYPSDAHRVPLTKDTPMLANPLADGDWEADVQAAIDCGAIKKADTLEELAELLGLDPDVVVGAVAHWNEICAAGVDTDFSVPYLPQWLIPIKEEGPYFGLCTSSRLSGTHCGLRVDEGCRVLDSTGTAIPGLYAGFMTAGGANGEGDFGGQYGNGTAALGGVGASYVGGWMTSHSLLADAGL